MGPRRRFYEGRLYAGMTKGVGGMMGRGLGRKDERWVPASGDLCIIVIPAPEPESRGGNLGLNPMSILPNMVSHKQLCKGLHPRGQREGEGMGVGLGVEDVLGKDSAA